MTERLVSERAELVALADKLEARAAYSNGEWRSFLFSSEQVALTVKALRRLAAQDQKPVAWIFPRRYGFGVQFPKPTDCTDHDDNPCEPEPLYRRPPPAAGWDEAIDACKKVAEKWLESFMGGEAYVARSIVNAIEALRTPAATKSADAGGGDWRNDPSADERWNAGLDFAMQQLCAVMGVDPKDVTWDAATETVDGDVRAVIWNILRAKMGEDWKPAPVAANASAELQNDLGEMLRALDMSDAAQPMSPHEVFQSAIAEMKRRLANASAEARLREALEDIAADHDCGCSPCTGQCRSEYSLRITVDAMRDIASEALSKPAPVDANASAEARLREAFFSWIDKRIENTILNQRNAYASGNDALGSRYHAAQCELWTVRGEFEALSAHPHASDCDKQGER